MKTEEFKGALLSALVIAPLMVTAISLLFVGSSSAAPDGLTPRAPIYIDGNTGFTLENGVNGGGSGTVGDPYIIENYIIDASTANGIDIRNTTAYFVVRNSVVENGGGTYYGIYLVNVVNGRAENNTCSNNIGIWVYSSNNNTVSGNTFQGNGFGIFLQSSSNNTIENNTCKNNYDGILLEHSNNNTLTNNTCENNPSGISLSGSENIKMRNNTLSTNQHNFGVVGASISHFVHDIDTSNLVNGKPIRYLVDNHDEVIGPSLNMGYLGLVNCDNIRVENLALWHNEQGILLAFTQNCLVENCILENNGCGIYLPRSDNNILSNNICENNDYYGIELGYSDNNTVGSNTCKNSQRGIFLYNSDNNPLINNNCENNDYGIMLYSSYNNTLTNNTCENNDWGIWLLKSDNNRIYHNNFINNDSQASDDSSNYWDNGYPWGGNYWSDYTGADIYRGEDQNLSGSDRIGDTPYYIPGDSNLDRYPLMNPFPLPWTGWARVQLPPIPPVRPLIWLPPCLYVYSVSLETNLALYQGSKLVLKFYTYGDLYQGENVVWSGTVPDNVSLSKIVPHPEGRWPENVRLNLTTDDTENVISTITSFTVRKVDLEKIFMEIPFWWAITPPEERVCIETVFLEIPFQWSGAPD